MGKHSPRRARIVFYDVAREQIDAMPQSALDRLDPVLDAIAADPTLGRPSHHGSVREYHRGGIRVVYVPTALGTLVLVAYVEA
ncbi:hypothetical protein JQK87_04525 [Streptomyces sp. G44]|uniref:hypothetical protein n=1 Tax=Streptomyces sp. G44 TaxID=2807632 RepID=UPI001960F70A|nr:hypothetical protein [Streptomyces sp. G44]MBM7167682.1 hypothetical protein [Streptomyces sp. G44]